MDPQDARIQLNIFIDNLPDSVFIPLRDRNIDPSLVTTDITSAYEFVIRETGHIVEGVRRVLAGEDSPNNFVAFIQKDEHIEEDNRQKIPVLAYEIQTKVFDPVLPILKQAGFTIKEGRVPEPPKSVVKDEVRSVNYGRETPPASEDGGAPFAKGDIRPPIDEKNARSLLRIAAGTTYTEGDLRSAFEALPQGLRQSISSVDTANAIQDVAKKHLLHVDQMAALASETGLVLLGLTHPRDFILNLARRLRVPEEKAREVARDISGQILSKVREALRGLHEDVKPPKENTEYRSSNIEKSRTTQQENTELNAKRYPPAGGLNASLKTPYSAGAKWNVGENILAKQAEEKLSREEMLHGIENPRSIGRNNLESRISNIEKYQNGQEENKRKGSEVGGLNASAVGPTGWKANQNEIGNMPARLNDSSRSGGKHEIRKPEIPVSNYQTIPAVPEYGTPFGEGETNSQTSKSQMMAPSPVSPRPSFKMEKVRPRSEGDTPPQSSPLKRGGGEENGTNSGAGDAASFLEQKLEQPMSIPREEKRYTTDPYREPLQ